MTTQPKVNVFENLTTLQQAAAELLVRWCREAVAASGACSIALAGGATPAGLYQLLAAEPYRTQISWKDVHVVWGDERFVAPDDPASNMGMARSLLLDHVPIPADHIVAVPTNNHNPMDAARLYSAMVREIMERSGGTLHIALLGMGADGHTASLFPYHPALDAPDDVLAVAVEDAPKPPPQRVTLTVAALNRVRQMLFLVAGADKAPILNTVLTRRAIDDPRQAPPLLLRPISGNSTWFVDQDAHRLVAASRKC